MIADGSGTSSALAPEGLVPVPVSGLRASSLSFALYIRRNESEAPQLYRGGEYPLENADLQRLAKRGVETLYVRSSDHATYRNYVLDGLARNDRLTPPERYKIIREVYRVVFDEAFRADTLDPMIEFTEEIGAELAEAICDNEIVLGDLFSLMEHDTGTYTHSVNVATYSLVLAKALGIREMPQLRAVATGAILHDIGKRQIQLSVLAHPGPLSPQQQEEMRCHPTIGFRDLASRQEISSGSHMMVYQHHERIDGTGYPVRLTGREIHDWAKICAVADVFHAMTSQRSYREALSACKALQYLEDQADVTLDGGVVRCWTAIMSNSLNP
ncbi:MAG: HD domain-containing protein [Candidatus Nealsonbacteria bacterium]|nr:HD domain-containing protein [Candidatus Nealsonbacteria bacterium]